MTSLKKQTVSGIKWLAGSSFLQKAISIVATVVLARILNPSIFGLFSLAFVAIDALGLFRSMGLDSALVRKKLDVEKAANTAFLIIPILGAILYLLLSIAAPLIGKFLNNQEVVSVVRALGIVFIISCFGRVPAAILEKNMQFKKVTIMEVSSTILYVVSAIVFALLKFGVWSLVIAYILRVLNQNILAWVFSKWHPRFEFDSKIAWEMFHFGKFIFLGAVMWFLRMNLDNLLVGKLLGVTALGYYAIAFNMANFVADYFGSKVNRVVFPAYSKLQDNIYDLRSASLKTLKFISIIVLPLGVGLFFLGESLIRILYGPKWIDAAGVLRVLVFAGVFNTLPVGFNAVFFACGKTKISFCITALQVILFLIFITPMARVFGMNGVGMVVSVSSIIAFTISLFLTMKLLSMKLSQVYFSIKPALISSFFMALGIIFFKNILAMSQGSFLQFFGFASLSIFSLSIFSFSLFTIEKKIFNDIKELLFL